MTSPPGNASESAEDPATTGHPDGQQNPSYRPSYPLGQHTDLPAAGHRYGQLPTPRPGYGPPPHPTYPVYPPAGNGGYGHIPPVAQTGPGPVGYPPTWPHLPPHPPGTHHLAATGAPFPSHYAPHTQPASAPVAVNARRTPRGRGTTSLILLLIAALGYTAISLLTVIAGGIGGVYAFGVSAISTTAVVTILWLLDRKHPEPLRYLALAFLWGGTGAIVIGIIPSLILFFAGGELISTVVGAPIGEEFGKAAFMLLLIAMRPEALASPVNGIVYAGLAGAGFAFVENLGYLGVAHNEGMLLFTWLLRGGLSAFAHSFFTMALGLAFAYGVTKSGGTRVAYLAGGYLIATTLHGLWNLGASFGLMFFVVYAAIMVPGFAAAVWFALRSRGRETTLVDTAARRLIQESKLTAGDLILCDHKTTRRIAAQHTDPRARAAVIRYGEAVRDYCALATLEGYGTQGPWQPTSMMRHPGPAGTGWGWSTASRNALMAKRHLELQTLRHETAPLIAPFLTGTHPTGPGPAPALGHL